MQEFLGCTSFGLRHLKRAEKEVNGWYHLLTEDVGCKKHLQVATRQRRPQTQTGKLIYEPRHENLFLSYVNNKGTDQPAHLHSLISPFVCRSFDSIIPVVAMY